MSTIEEVMEKHRLERLLAMKKELVLEYTKVTLASVPFEEYSVGIEEHPSIKFCLSIAEDMADAYLEKYYN